MKIRWRGGRAEAKDLVASLEHMAAEIKDFQDRHTGLISGDVWRLQQSGGPDSDTAASLVSEGDRDRTAANLVATQRGLATKRAKQLKRRIRALPGDRAARSRWEVGRTEKDHPGN